MLLALKISALLQALNGTSSVVTGNCHLHETEHVLERGNIGLGAGLIVATRLRSIARVSASQSDTGASFNHSVSFSR